jgi:hypothetical protein
VQQFLNDSVPLYVYPKIRTFNRDQQRELVLSLERLDQNSETEPIVRCEELQLRPDGTTKQGGRRYTALAFKQVSTLLGPGVGRLMPDLSGTRHRDIPPEFLSASMAIYFFNSILDRRFPALTAFRSIRNLETNQIEGLLGHKHQVLKNSDFIRSVDEAMNSAPIPTAFYAARLIGRQLFVWWRATTPFLTLPVCGKQWSFYRGYYACNGEITGLSMRASNAIFTPTGVCLGPYKSHGTRVSHRGRKFMQRINAELGKVANRDMHETELRTQIGPALDHSLGFTVGMTNKAIKQRLSILAALLRRLGVDYNLANEVLQQAVIVGRDIGKPDIQPPAQVDRLYATRTALDLLICLLHTARRLDMQRREKLEQAGFHLITGKFF